jgi:glutamate-1-semialdehyde 2,1-aminomutase
MTTTGPPGRTVDQALRARAARVIPGGMYGHQSVAGLSTYPQFFSSAEGALIRDVDGNTYVDLMCSYGPIILGHHDPRVEAAAATQRALADCQNAPSERAVELAELLVETVADADWAIFAKNGTDATTACLTIARAATGRSVVLAAAGSYHGAAPWCTPRLDGVLPTDRVAMRYFEYNDVASLQRAADEAGADLAAVIITPFKHIEGLDQQLVDPGFARAMRALCDQRGALLIVDDVRAGLRLGVGGSWEEIGVAADLSAWSKALGNGYPIAAVTGREALRDPAGRVFLTGSFWFSAVSMAASIATLTALRDGAPLAAMRRAGRLLREGIVAQAQSHDLTIHYTGPDVMPYLTFAADTDHERISAFAEQALSHGVYLHPRHNWFLSAAHTDDLVGRALDATDQAFAHVRRVFGNG